MLMKKIRLFTIIALLIPIFTFGQGFTTDNTNGNLIDANGKNFIMKGMNVPLAWYQTDVNNSIPALRTNTGSNCLRIVVNAGKFGTTLTPDLAWQTCVQRCIDNNMIPMVELHDVTGNTTSEALQEMAAFWASKADFLTRPDIAKYILINIANEWGTWQVANTNGVAWRDAHIDAIETIRNAGIKTTLVVDAVGYGQDIRSGENTKKYAKDIQAADAAALESDANLLFSIHMYCEWRVGANDPATVGTIKEMGIPIIVGEFGYQHASDGSCDIDEQNILDVCEENGVGWLAWSQKGNSTEVAYLDLCNDWACTDLSDWGNTIINGRNGTKTAETASVFENDPTGNIAQSDLTKNLVYPNPTTGTVHIEGLNSDTWTLHDVTGVQKLSGNNSRFDISVFQPGVYYLKISNKVVPIVKQ